MAVAIILKTPDFNQKVTEEKVIYVDAAYKFSESLPNKNVLGVVGDFDSLGYIPKNNEIVLLNEEKDFTDGERAVLFAKECGETEIVIYGAYGGRLEHILGNIALLKVAQKLGLKSKIKLENGFMELLGTGKYRFSMKRNGKASFIPYGGNCSFLKSEGLYYKLDGLTLMPDNTRGISNVATSEEISFEILNGETLFIYDT